MSIKIVAFREDSWFFDETTDFRMWDHLCRAYNVEVQLIREWSEAITDGRPIYLFVEEGTELMSTHVIDPNGLYVFGRTGLNLLLAVPEYTKSIKIETPNEISLFGVCAASMFLCNNI